MATIITSHLGEQEQGERKGGGGGERGKKDGTEVGYEGTEAGRENEKCQIPGSVLKCQGEEREKV